MEYLQKERQQLSLEEKRAMVEELLRKRSKRNDKTYQMSYGQRALWFIQESFPGNTSYNIAFAHRNNFEININTLCKALQKLVDRHDALRTVYPKKDGIPVQVVRGHQKLSFEEIDVREIDEGEIKELTAEFNRRPFSLEEGPIMRTALFKVRASESIFVFSIHHIACDFFSLMVLQKELLSLYYGLEAGKADTLPKPAYQFADYCRWQDTVINSQTSEEMLNYWKKQFEGDLPVLEITTDKPRPPIQTFNGAALYFEIDSVLSNKLKSLALSQGVTLFILILSAFQILLHRYTNQDDTIVGIPLSGRNQKGFNSIVGYMTNMAPVRGRFSGNQSFEQFLAQVKDTVIGAMKHGEYPFPLLVEKLRPHRDPGRSPVFQVTFELLKHQQMVGEGLFRELKISPYEVPQQDGQFDIMLTLNEMADNFIGVFSYNTDLFAVDTIKRIVESFIVLLNTITVDPKQGINELPILSESDKMKLLKEWNNTGRKIDEDSFVHHLFEKQAESTPRALAVYSYDGRMTYWELNQKSNRLAHYLQSLGMGLHKRIGICMKPSKYMVIALLGVLKCGATYVPIDPEYPEKRIEYIVDDADVEVILSTKDIFIPDAGEAIRVNVDVSEGDLLRQSDSNPQVQLSPQNIAYILYTSGSTGTPKGVEVYHIGMLNYLLWCAQEYIKPNDNTSMPASFAHLPLVSDASITSLYTPLITGRYLLIPKKQGLEIFDDPAVQKGGFSFVKLTPAHLSLLKEKFIRKEMYAFAKRVIIGGEALFSEHLAYLKRCGLDWTIINEYGPTETVVGSTSYSFSIRDDVPSNIPIGKPIMNTNIFILDSQNLLAPVGAIGEIAIGGIGVSKGYVNREDLTREKYITNSFIKRENKYIYKTGDLGRWLPDGNIEYIGRADHQVKIRGYRIELGEVEAVLAKSPGVKAAAVVVQEVKPGDRQLAGYYIAEEEYTGGAQEIMDYLKSRLPGYMVPANLRELAEIPMNRNGKVDRLLLSTRAFQKTTGTNLTEDRSHLEQELVAIWKQILDVDYVGIDDGFSQLGGHSLLAVQIISKIDQKYVKKLPIMELYPNGTIRKIAGLLEAEGITVQKKADSVIIKEGNSDQEHNTLFREPHTKVLEDASNSIPKPKPRSDISRCTKCALPKDFPNIRFDNDGVCNYCTRYEEEAVKRNRYKVEDEDELIERLQRFKGKGNRYDVLIPLSGGVDSSATLIRVVENYNLKVLAFHNDHGFEDETATRNVRKLCKAMDVDLIISQQDLGFMKKLWRYTHEARSIELSSCFVCGGIIYANSLEIADRYNIPLVINGYSKGQVHMMGDKRNALEAWTGLLSEFRKDGAFLKEFMQKLEPMKKQIVFKDKDDLMNELPYGKILVIPFFLFDFYKTDKEELEGECIKRFDWKPVKYTYPSRTTNCPMVWLNTYVDKCKMGYSMYDEEYAGIVRAGDMTRSQAINDLLFNPPEGLVERLAREIGTDLSNFMLIR